jgi:hypothetical protein
MGLALTKAKRMLAAAKHFQAPGHDFTRIIAI